MKKTLLSLIILSMMSIAHLYSQEDAADVKDTFQSYREAILNDKGAEAVKYVDSNTINYYKRMVEVSLEGDSASVAAMPLMDRLTVLTVRHRVPKEDVQGMTGEEFFIYAINNGMVGKNSVQNLSIGEVNVEGQTAKGQMVNSGIPTPLYFSFHKNSDWKLDLTSIFEPTNKGLSQMISGSGMSEEEWILGALEMLTGKTPDNSIWHPME